MEQNYGKNTACPNALKTKVFKFLNKGLYFYNYFDFNILLFIHIKLLISVYFCVLFIHKSTVMNR